MILKSHRFPLVALVFAAAFVFHGNAGRLDPSLPVIFNQDSSEFFVASFGPVEPPTIDRYVDSLSGTGITDLFVCVNAQRTNFRSSVWQADWDGYDPSLGDDQPYFAGIPKDRAFERDWYRMIYAWSKTGADYPGMMLAAAKRNHLRGWISIRMNDAHYPEYRDHPYHSAFWKQHPEWHLANSSLDYAQPEVREHYLKLIREVTERYDIFGLELDFMRHGHYFKPDEIEKGRDIMNAFVRQVRAATAAAAVRLGHPVQLAVRVPSRPWIAAQRGLDAVSWGRDRFVDLIAASPWWASAQVDIPIEAWKGLLEGTGVRVVAALEDGLRPDPKGERKTLSPEEARGALLSFASRNADALYLFNWFAGPLHEWSKQEYHQFFVDSGSITKLAGQPRRHPVTLIDPWAEGEPGNPLPLRTNEKSLTLRIHIGPRPDPDAAISVQLGVAAGSPPVNVRLNQAACRRDGRAGSLEVYQAPAGTAREGYNLVRIELPENTKLSWAEIRIVPPPVHP